MADRVAVADRAIEVLVRDLQQHRERVLGEQRTLQRDAAEVRRFLREVLTARRDAVRRATERVARTEPGTAEHAEALRVLRTAEAALERAERARAIVEAHLLELESTARAHQRDVARNLEWSTNALHASERALVAYLANAAPGADGGGGAYAGVPGPTSRSAAVLTLEVPVGFPQGFAMVPLSAIDDGDSRVSGPADFSKSAPSDMEWAHSAFLDVVLPTLAAGGTLDDLRERDLREGRQGDRSCSQTFTGFLRDASAITLDRRGDRFEVGNGFHRIWTARRLGLSAVPAKVTGDGV